MSMSRLIVKNLPENIKESRLREIFSDYGEVTDIKLCFTKKGVFRKFAFIGYKDDNEASLVTKALNKTFIDTSKIIVESCTKLGETSESRPWSKYSQGSSAFRKHKKEVDDRKKRINLLQQLGDQKTEKSKKKQDFVGDQLSDVKDDKTFQEFMSIHSNKKQIWSNNENNLESSILNSELIEEGKKDSDSSCEEDKDKDEEDTKQEHVENEPLGDGDENCLTLKMRGIPFKSKEHEIIEFFKPIYLDDIRFAKDKAGKRTGYAFVDFKNSSDVKKAMKKNNETMKGRYVELFLAPHKDNSNRFKKESWNVTEDVLETGRLFVRNLSYTCREEDLEKLFSKYGNIVEVQVPIDKNSNRSTGFAFITFMMPEHAMKAWNELDGKIYQGRILHVIPGKSKKEKVADINEDSSYKKKKEAEKKGLSGSAYNWNALFLGQNAVANVMAERLNKDKRDLFEGEAGGSVAVNMALGETELVNETRTFLQSHGVNLDVFGQANSTRSKNVILVKNLPSSTTKEELSEIFSKHGELGRVLMPPFGITAIIEFIDASDAKKAFLNLAYSKFKHIPLYLEWAPVDVLSGEVTITKEDTDEADDEDSDSEEEEGTVIYVKNLNFSTSEEKMKAIFSTCGKIKEVTIAKKKDPKKDGSMLSMGYGFVRFKKSQYAEKAIESLQGCQLDGHKLELKKSHRETVNSKSSRKRVNEKKQTSSKIVVRNIPFEASVKEVKDLFSKFGNIKSVRLPKKMAGTGSHRGFAFVDFTTKQDAKIAFKALCLSTHLYGRRLVLEWAEEETSIEALQQNTANKYDNESESLSKRSKLTIL